jgi:hypothetical protein
MSGACAFLSLPLDVGSQMMYSFRMYVLLTAADGINCFFQLLVADIDRGSIKVQIASPCGTWHHVTSIDVRNDDILLGFVYRNRVPIILHGGIIHWLVYIGKQIVSCDLRTQKLASMKLPHNNCEPNQLQLVTTEDGKLLKVLTIQGFMISVWRHDPILLASGSSWSLESVVDMEKNLRSLHPDIPINSPNERIVFKHFFKRTGDVVLLRVPGRGYYDTITVFDLETKDMHTQGSGYSLLEIDLPSRLQNMKIFS